MYNDDFLCFILYPISSNIFVKIKKVIKNFKRKKEIDDCFNQTTEKIVSELEGLAIVAKEEEEEKLDIKEVFLKKLQYKVRQLEGVFNVEYKFGDRLLFFSIETQKLRREELAKKLIDLVDDHTKFFFFQRQENLSIIGWCAKYMLHSDLRANSIQFNVRNIRVIQFVWFRNIFRHKICHCFICSEFKKEKKNDENQNSSC